MIKTLTKSHMNNRLPRSQFIREKLDRQYDPVPPTRKDRLMSCGDIPQHLRFQYLAREENEICTKAIKKLKEGSSLIIDWNTKTNFHSTHAKFRQFRTEPIHNEITNSPSSSSQQRIKEKKLNLARLLFKSKKKAYMRTRFDGETEKLLFGQNYNNSSKQSHLEKSKISRETSISKARRSILDVQSEIFSKCKLKILREDLKLKFEQIRCKLNRNDRSFENKLQVKKGIHEGIENNGQYD